MIPSQFSTFRTGKPHSKATLFRKLREAHRRRLIFDAPEPLKRWRKPLLRVLRVTATISGVICVEVLGADSKSETIASGFSRIWLSLPYMGFGPVGFT